MSPEERDKMVALCKQIELEKDNEKVKLLVAELNDLLDGKENHPGGRPTSSAGRG